MTLRELHLTPDAPWAGPAAYTERDAPFFHGRGAETVELHRLIRAEPVCVLYALSGLGKTSLLQAGVFPRLRAEGWLPMRIRLDHRDLDDDGQPLPTLTTQVLDLITQAAQAQGCTTPAWDREHDRLVTALHERGERFWGQSEDQPVTPVLVFDQFEECWTLTRERPAARARAEALLGELAALIDWQGKGQQQPAPLRLVFSLREDQLAPLDALRPLFPNLRRARLRLLPFSATQAMEVVTLSADGGQAFSLTAGRRTFSPAPPTSATEDPTLLQRAESPPSDRQAESLTSILDPGAAEAIVSTFASADPDRPSADPALLSIFCWRLNEDRRSRGADAISAARVVELRGQFVKQFYDAAFAQLSADQAQAARRFVETDLIDAAGFRSSGGFEHAEKRYGVRPANLDALVDARLLHPVDRSGGHRHVELVHDRIGEEALRQRTAREEAEAKARAEEEKTRLQRDLARARRRAVLLTVLTVLALVAMVFALVMQQRAEAAERRAEEALIAFKDERTRADQADDKTRILEKELKVMQDNQRRILDVQSRLPMTKSVDTPLANYRQEHPPEKGDRNAEREQAVRLSQDGNLRLSSGNPKLALESYQMAFAIAERLAQQDPGNAEWQRDLSVGHEKIGDAQVAAGNGKAALESYQKSLAIAERLAQQDPGNAERQRDLSYSHYVISQTQEKLGDAAAALRHAEAALKIDEKLAALDPTNATWQDDVKLSRAQVARLRGDRK